MDENSLNSLGIWIYNKKKPTYFVLERKGFKYKRSDKISGGKD